MLLKNLQLYDLFNAMDNSLCNHGNSLCNHGSSGKKKY